MEIIIFIAIVVGIIVWKKKRKETTNNTGDENTTEEQVENIEEREESQEEKQEIKEDVIEESKDETTNEPFPVYWYEDGVKKEGTAIMSKQGLQVFDENGNQTLDITTRLTKCLGTLTISADTSSGEITDEAFKTNDLWVVITQITNPYFSSNYSNDDLTYIPLPTFTQEDGKMKWEYKESDTAKRTGCVIVYGVY
jgi:hypothetical protein